MMVAKAGSDVYIDALRHSFGIWFTHDIVRVGFGIREEETALEYKALLRAAGEHSERGCRCGSILDWLLGQKC